jgi:hypothetical protein
MRTIIRCFALTLSAVATGVAAQDAAALDTNQDGVLSLAEAEYDGRLKLEFSTLDANADGRLDRSEIGGLREPSPGVQILREAEGDAVGAPGGGTTGTGAGTGAGTGTTATPGLPAGGGAAPTAPAPPSAGAAGRGR